MMDVCIVGGGIAGATAAILLGRTGLTVDLFDQQTFPREKACGEGIMPAGVAAFQRLGLIDVVAGEPFYGIRYHVQNIMAEGRFPTIHGIPANGLCQRRLHLDQALLYRTSSIPNVSIHTNTRVLDLLSNT